VIVADQRRAAVDQPERQVGLAAARRASMLHPLAADGDAGGLDREAHSLGVAGRRATKRAPRLPSCRSSAQILPSWPSKVALAIARPRPEWRPKCSSARRTLWKRRNTSSRSASGTA